jgi:hypothetical protein
VDKYNGDAVMALFRVPIKRATDTPLMQWALFGV